MSSEEICAIIRECGSEGVTSIKISKDAIEIKFGEAKPPETRIEVSPESVPQATLIQTQAPDQLEVTERDPKEIDAEQELQELQITDPLEYENRLAQGELVDGVQEDL